MMRKLLTMVLFLFIPAISYSSIVDQQQLEVDGTLGFIGAGRVAQTFNAGISGQLELIEFGMFDSPNDDNPIYVQIRETQNGAPIDTILAEVSVELTDQQASDYSTTYVWAFGDFRDESIELTAGEQYALVVYTTSYDGASYVLANYDHPYGGGQVWAFTSSANQWDPYINSWAPEGLDLCFRTTMVPEPATLLLLGLGGLMIRKRK